MDWNHFGHLTRRRRSQLNQEYTQLIQDNTLYDQPSFKQVMAPMAKHLLSSVLFDNSIEQKECPIDSDKFINNEELLRLPCKHLFRKASIMNWLENRSATCPVCRYQLPYIEVRNEELDNSSDTSLNVTHSYELEDDIIIGRSNFLSSLAEFYREVINRSNNYF